MAKDSRQFTAFTVPGFGLHSASATFQRALDSVTGADMEPFSLAYLDDIIVIGAMEEQHLANLGEVFRRLRRANLKKCEPEEMRVLQAEVSLPRPRD